MNFEYYKSSDTLKPIGLHNSSNYCWINSIMQLLMGLPSFISTIRKIPSDGRTPITNQLLSSITYNNSSSPSIINIAPNIVNCLINIRGNQLGHGQSCADEGLVTILDLISDRNIDHLFNNIYGFIIICPHCKQEVSNVRDKSTRILITENKSMNADEFKTNLLKRVTLCSDYRCNNCQIILNNIPRIEFLRVIREIIIIVFDKFYTKDNLYQYPEHLTFPKPGGGQHHYKLCGIIDHYGTMSGGHYTCRSLRNDKWYMCNDSSVSESNPTPTTNTFMIAYHITND